MRMVINMLIWSGLVLAQVTTGSIIGRHEAAEITRLYAQISSAFPQ